MKTENSEEEGRGRECRGKEDKGEMMEEKESEGRRKV